MKTTLSWQYDEFQQVGKDYGQVSEVEVYDESHSKFRDIEKECLAIMDDVQLASDDILIDFGCGTGVMARLAAERCQKVVAVDVSKAMLDYARSKTSAPNVTFAHAGYLTFEHEGEAPAVINSSLSFHHLPDFWKGIALKRIYDLLAPRGRFFMVDVILTPDQPIEKISKFIEKQTELGGDFLKEDAEEHFRDEYSTYDWVIEGLLERAGFQIETKNTYDGIIATYLCRK
jgi:putative AdoMet-dependent methyltransferase